MVRALAFVVCAAVVGLYALRGGSFDVVPRAELGIAAWWIVALGWAVGVLPRARVGRAGWLPAFGLLALAAWTALSLRWSESDQRTAAELARVFHHAGLLVLALSVLCRETWRAGVAGVLAGAVGVCALAVASRLWPDAFPADLVGASFGTGRLSYPLNYWNAVAAWGAMTATVALSLSAHGSLATRCLSLSVLPVAVLATYLTYSRAGVAGVALGLLVVWACARARAVVLVHAAVAGLGSAAAIMAVRAHPAIARAEGGAGQAEVLLALAVAAALCAATAFVTWRLRGEERWRLSPRVAHRVAAVSGVAAIAVGALTLPPAVPRAVSAFKDRDAIVTTDDPSARLGSLSGQRFNSWSSAFASFRAEPLAGTGAGTFEFWWSREARDAEFVVDAHSLYLETLAELGLPGLLCVLVLCGGGLYVAVRARRGAATTADAGAATAVLAAFAVWLFHAGVDWMWESTATVAFALLLVAAAAAARSENNSPGPFPKEGLSLFRKRGPDRAAPPRTPHPTRAAARALIVVLALVGVAVQLPALVGASSLRVSQAAAREQDDRRALGAARDASATLPWAASPHVQLALLAENRGDLPQAEREAREAVALEPTNWRHRLLLARVLAQRGDAQAALAAFAVAERLRPLGRPFSA
ncbi:O-antigen ligase family protein [Solirubrobacter sp. CPCC 204708]|uniref:O-antigen ligase family protein n=1 Tax=Solirubrobacter deserti TaxID=2282478 RepID=A0ABT4RU44_9ACTN|nr:O-antigen ligase family protein [Solirubrobacter deserti]MBE2314495.1 O-antigen ligase family protein [Solirubrobacter deserti]MDA0142102.1 O-antigen ligase family protein [Solirubrobacter deserti]